MQNTSKQDHEQRALATIESYISIAENIQDWKSDDLKTQWLQRAKHIGVDGYSAHLRDMFIGKKKAAAC